MDDVTICIPTLGRLDSQITWGNLCSGAWASRTFLVVSAAEAPAFREAGFDNLIVSPVQGAPGKILGDVRQWLMENAPTRYVIMPDDDLHFGARRYDAPGKFRAMNGQDEIDLIFTRLRMMLDQVPYVGMDDRSGGNRSAVPAMQNGRMYALLGVDTEVFMREKFHFDRVLIEDFDAQLQFLRRGYWTARLTTHYKADMGSNSEGGVSAYRNLETQKAACLRLKELHPEFITVVTKEAKSWGGGMEVRTDVRVAWAKAFKAGLALRDLLGEDQEAAPDWSDLAPDWEMFS